MIAWTAAAFLASVWQQYLFFLDQSPLLTKSATSAFISGASDLIAQRIMKGHLSHDYRYRWRRTLYITVYGGVYTGPAAHLWQDFLEGVFSHRADTWTVLQKVLIDQTTYGPFCNILFLAFATIVLEGKSIHLLHTKVRRDFPLVQLNGWKVWPLAALINYKFVPLQFRVLFINVVALCWSIFLLLRARNLAAASQQPAQAGGGKAAAAEGDAAAADAGEEKKKDL